jgi:hypothetical protein
MASMRGEATIDHQCRSRYEGSLFRSQEEDSRSNFLRLGETPQRDILQNHLGGHQSCFDISTVAGRQGRSRAKTVHADVVFGIVHGELPRECNDAPLRSGVRWSVGKANESQCRRMINDGPAVAFDHDGKGVFHAQKSPLQVQIEDSSPFFFGGFGDETYQLSFDFAIGKFPAENIRQDREHGSIGVHGIDGTQ